jgi:chromosome segregation ATPase
VEYLNQYVEVLNNNLAEIIKQNISLQTNLQITEKNLSFMVEKDKNNSETIKQSEELVNKNRELQNKVNELESVTSSYKTLADERSRLQIALNETSQKLNKVEGEFNAVQQELLRLRAKSNELDKLKVSLNTPAETPKVEKKTKKVTALKSAGTF